MSRSCWRLFGAAVAAIALAVTAMVAGPAMAAVPGPTDQRDRPHRRPGGRSHTDRPVLEQLLDQLRSGDTLVVWKLDRLGRSLRHLVDTITSLAERGVGFRNLQEAIDLPLPGYLKPLMRLPAGLGDLVQHPRSVSWRMPVVAHCSVGRGGGGRLCR